MGNQGLARALGAVAHGERKGIKLIHLKATKQLSDNENAHHRQTYGGLPASHLALPHTTLRIFARNILIVQKRALEHLGAARSEKNGIFFYFLR